MDYSAEHPLPSWQERVTSYPRSRNALWDIVNAYRELGIVGDTVGRPRDAKTGLPGFSEAEMAQIIQHLDNKSALKRLWQEHNPAVTDYQHYAHDSGYNGAQTIQNIRHYAPVSLLVCPTKQYLCFEHFVDEASPQEIGRFFKAVLHSAREETLAHDAKVGADPELAKLRAFYEDAFAKAREAVSNGARPEDIPWLHHVTQCYLEDSAKYGFAARNPRTGHSGFRIFMNNLSESAGMSQPHFHVQVAGGRFLGHAYSMDPAKEYSGREIDYASKALTM